MGTGWTENDAVHLLSRTTFHVSSGDVSAALSLGKEETVRRLIEGIPLTGDKKPVPPIEEMKADGKELRRSEISDEQTYWLYRMAASDEPLREKMTLFWHDHFATSYRKVNDVALMRQQNEMLRSLALGSFRELVLEVGRDPAMLIWLDSNSNKKGKPNENYAREVMELFTLGLGNYTEEDIKEAARAFTGWGYDRTNKQVVFAAKQHDTGWKKVLGETGNFDEKSVVDVLFRQKALAPFMARNLLAFFGTPNPSEQWVAQVAADVAGKETVGEVLRSLFESDEFYKPEYRLTVIKTPAEYVAGIVRAFDIPMSKSFVSSMRKMGQELYMPPDVAGWDGGAAWLMASSLLSRSQFAESVSKRIKTNLFTTAPYTPARKDKAEEWVDLWGRHAGLWDLSERSRSVIAKYADETFVHAASKVNGMRGMLQLLMISPEAQMK
jgi:uncharacterized protein (DUF1800 family)